MAREAKGMAHRRKRIAATQFNIRRPTSRSTPDSEYRTARPLDFERLRTTGPARSSGDVRAAARSSGELDRILIVARGRP